MIVKLYPDVMKELEFLIELMDRENDMLQFDTIEELTVYVMNIIADGSRRPGSHARGMLDDLGLSTEQPEHLVYRSLGVTNGYDEDGGESP